MHLFKFKDKYKVHTVKEVINALQRLVEENEEITMDSEVILSDFNFSGFTRKTFIAPTHRYEKNCICLFSDYAEFKEPEEEIKVDTKSPYILRYLESSK